VYTDLEATTLFIEINLIFTHPKTFQSKIQEQLNKPSHFLMIFETKPDNDFTMFFVNMKQVMILVKDRLRVFKKNIRLKDWF